MVPGLKHTAYRIDKANWKLFYGNSSATLTLNGDGLPTESFRCAITLSSVSGHTDVVGSVTVGSETISFSAATRKTTITILTALPVITTTALDCYIVIEAINTSGNPIVKETSTAVICRWDNTQRSYRDSLGNWAASMAQAITKDTNCTVGTILQYGGINYVIKQVQPFSKLSGTEFLRRVYLG